MAMVQALSITNICNIRASSHDVKPNTHRHSQTKGVVLNGNIHLKHAKKLKEIKHVLAAAPKDSMDTLLIIDGIQRFGIEYHFEKEIEAALQELHQKFGVVVNGGNGRKLQLHEVALQFRLLRQHGYHVCADVLDRFMDYQEMHKRTLSDVDILGLVSLYEASQLGIQGEDSLDEAGNCSHELLNAWISRNQENHHRKSIIRNVLQFPFQKSFSKFAVRSFNMYQTYQGANEWLSALEDLANMESIILKPIYHKEVSEITKWWKELDLARDLQLVREEPLKWYLWAMTSITDPSLSELRVDIIKPLAMVYIIDDIFDIYGTIEELTFFTDVVNRWDLAAAMKELPDYMKKCFKTLDDITNELADKIMAKHGWNPKHNLQKEWGKLCNAFLVETKWLATGKLPKAEEYLKNGIVSSGVQAVLSHIFFYMSEGITNETINSISNNPRIVSCTATILRLCDDLEKAKELNEVGRDGSYVECYMNEHKGIQLEEALKLVDHMIANAWKGLNEECISPTPWPKSLKKVCLNAARMVALMYGYNGNEDLPTLANYLKLLIYDRDSDME